MTPSVSTPPRSVLRARHLAPGADPAALFDAVAESYAALRPGYPESLVEEVLGRGGVPPRSRALEVGAGAGQATEAFARRGLRLVCLEPGPRLAALAEARFRHGSGVSVQRVRFEDWELREGAFDLVLSAQAFHWLDPEVAYVRAGRALRPGGALALFWNRPQGYDPAVRRELDAVYREHAPELLSWQPERELSGVREAIEATGLFGPVRLSRHFWTDRRSAADYAALLATYSDHASLPEARRRALLDAVRTAVERQGGSIAVAQAALLYLARRRGDV